MRAPTGSKILTGGHRSGTDHAEPVSGICAVLHRLAPGAEIGFLEVGGPFNPAA